MAEVLHHIKKEFVLKTLVETKDPVDIHYRRQRFKGQLHAFNKEILDLQLMNMRRTPQFEKNAEINLFFRFRNIPITCKVSHLRSEEDRFTFTTPPSMYRDLTRRYERIAASNQMSVSIIINDEKMNINFPTSASYYDPPEVKDQFTAPKISDILQAFRKRCAVFSSENNIIMFRDRKPSTIAERLLAISGKVLALPFKDLEALASADSEITFFTSNDIDWIGTETAESPEMLHKKLNYHTRAMEQRKKFHELYLPILYHEYVIGYIYIMRGESHKTDFTPEQLEMLHQFSRLLIYSLKAVGYFKTNPVRERFSGSELIDISASGLLFSYPPDAPPINLYADVDLAVKIGEKTLPLHGKVIRKFRDSNQAFIGIQFTGLEHSSREYLLKELYGDDYDGTIEIQ